MAEQPAAAPIKKPGKMKPPPIHAGMMKRPVPPPFPLGKAPVQHFAQGTDNVNTNAQGMQTMPGQGGTWGAPAPAPAPPITAPMPAGMPRTTFGLRKPVQGYAGGTSDVPPVDPMDTVRNWDGGQTLVRRGISQQDAATAGYNMGAEIARRGLQDRFPGYAQGTSNVPDGNTNFATENPNNQPGLLDHLLSGSFGPFSFGDAARAPMQGPPQAPPPPPAPLFGGIPTAGNPFPPQAPAPAGSVQPVRSIGDVMLPDPSTIPHSQMNGPPIPAQNPSGGPPATLAGMLMNAPTSNPPSVVVHGGAQGGDGVTAPYGISQQFAKTVGDPQYIDAISKAVGSEPRHTNAMMNPHQYTRDEFVAATQDMPWGIAEKLWNMQHYLTPQQQLVPAYMKQLNQDIATADQARQQAKPGTQNFNDATKAHDNATNALRNFLRITTEGQGAALDQN